MKDKMLFFARAAWSNEVRERFGTLSPLLLLMFMETDMKIVLSGFVIVAGLVMAAGGALMGRTDDPSAQQTSSCAGTVAVAARSAEPRCSASCCETKLVSVEAKEEKSGCCSKASCGAEKQLVSTQSPSACGSTACSVATQGCGAKADVVLTSTEVAKDGKCCKECKTQCVKQCETACGTKQGDCEGQCPVSVALQRLPRMTYAVGSAKTDCSEQAKQLAEQHNAPVHYVVADKEYQCCQSAMAALVDQTERFVNTFVSVRRCPASGTTFACGKSTSCSAEAQQWTATIGQAVDQVKMCYVVDGQQTSCSASAEAQAREKEAPVEYVVGDQQTSCPLSARLELARAKYKSVVQAMAASSTSS